jgi:hypothetical protein
MTGHTAARTLGHAPPPERQPAWLNQTLCEGNRTLAHGSQPDVTVPWKAPRNHARAASKDTPMTTMPMSASTLTEVNPVSRRAGALADRLEQGANALIAAVSGLAAAEWQTRIPGDGRKIGIVVHHVATMYPLEIQLAQMLAAGTPVTGVTWDLVHQMNAAHAAEHDAVTPEAALDLLRRNSAAAAAAIRALSDEELDRAAAISLNADAPLTCQFMLEDHAVRHSYHHLARIRQALTAAQAQTDRAA